MGKEHHAGRPSWVPAFLVVVSILSAICMCKNKLKMTLFTRPPVVPNHDILNFTGHNERNSEDD